MDVGKPETEIGPVANFRVACHSGTANRIGRDYFGRNTLT